MRKRSFKELLSQAEIPSPGVNFLAHEMDQYYDIIPNATAKEKFNYPDELCLIRRTSYSTFSLSLTACLASFV